MSPLKGFLNKLFSRNSSHRRRADRLSSPELAAYFWAGGSPVQHRVRDISSTGLYLITEDRWFPGTLIMLTLQNNEAPESSPARSMVIQAKVARRGDDGVGLVFMLTEVHDPGRGKLLFKSGADRRTLDNFLKSFISDSGRAVIQDVILPPTNS